MIRNFALSHLPSRRVEQVRTVRDHLSGAFQALRRFDGAAAPLAFPREASGLVKSLRRTYSDGSESDREAAIRTLMAAVRIERGYWPLIGSKALLTDLGAPLQAFGVGAARYAEGRWSDAEAAFRGQLTGPHAALAHLSLARTLIVGRGDEPAGRDILEAGLRQTPGNLPLRQELAASYYRSGEMARANECIAPALPELRERNENSPATVNIASLDAEIAGALRDKLTQRPKGPAQDTYGEDLVEWYWRDMWWSMNTYDWSQQAYGWLRWLYENTIVEVLTQVNPSIKKVVNFGCLCAEADARAAKRFPEKRFFGVDREQSAKRMNDLTYASENLSFLAANVADHIDDLAAGEATLLFHARTGTLCYPEYLRGLYKRCAKAGVKAVALFENNALERRNYRYLDFDQMDDALPYVQHMFIHNYPRYLQEAGFKIHTARRLPYQDLIHDDPALGSDGHIVIIATLE